MTSSGRNTHISHQLDTSLFSVGWPQYPPPSFVYFNCRYQINTDQPRQVFLLCLTWVWIENSEHGWIKNNHKSCIFCKCSQDSCTVCRPLLSFWNRDLELHEATVVMDKIFIVRVEAYLIHCEILSNTTNWTTLEIRVCTSFSWNSNK